jgi:blue copper oxidase
VAGRDPGHLEEKQPWQLNNGSIIMKRRNFIKSSALGLGGLTLGAGSGLTGLGQDAHAQTPVLDPFSRPFQLPPMDTGKRDGNQLHFDLSVQPGSSNFIGRLDTPTMGINGDYLGPTLRAKRDDNVSFAVKNNLSEVTTLHWHGLVLPAEMDGGPHQVIHPGETWRPEFNIVQNAATFWYHAHTHGRTGAQVYHGLAGMFIVDDDVSQDIDLPTDYGIDDIPVVIQDRAFNRNGSLRYLGSMPDQMRGMHGNFILVNGVVTPTLKAERPLTRLRLLNGSNARIYNLAFNDNRPFAVIAADGGLLAQPELVKGIRLAPGERAEILIDLSDGRDIILRNRPQSQTSGGGMMQMMDGGNQAFDIMKIISPTNTGNTLVRLPAELSPLPDWSNANPTSKRQFELEMAMGPRMMMSRMMGGSTMSINGESFDMDVVNIRVRSNTFEIWEIGNNSMLAHPFHIHNTQFKVLARSGRSISATEKGLKDTVLVYPQEKVRLLVPFPEYSDPERPYMYHCHILEHEDAGMMGQFTVEA